MIYTIGHSTRSIDEFLELLHAHQVGRLADIRTVPRSRRHPHFAQDQLADSLSRTGVAYKHFPGLGGLRKPRPDSVNVVWRNTSFRGYADHMETPAFARALEDLLEFAGLSGAEDALPLQMTLMCAEAVWWRCHRQLVADALTARGIEVRHITTPGAPSPHELTEFARVVNGQVSYAGMYSSKL